MNNKKKPCINCGEELGKGKSKFCSTDCKNEHHHPKRNCLECGIQLDKEYKYCSLDCGKKHKYSPPPQRYCKVCGVEVGKRKGWCSIHNPRIHNCKEDGCDEVIEFRKHYCEEHSVEKKHQQHLNEMKICNDCGGEYGKRKDTLSKRRCDDCIEKIIQSRKERERVYRREYYNDRYNNDLEYREKHRVSMKKWRDKKKKVK